MEVRGGGPKRGHGASGQLRYILPGWLEAQSRGPLLGPMFKGEKELF